jgi:hypothetical protein
MKGTGGITILSVYRMWVWKQIKKYRVIIETGRKIMV